MTVSTRLIQNSFSSGEIAPELYGRIDLQQYTNGLKECRNFLVKPHGGIVNRPGLEHVCEVKDSTKRVRLLPFNFNAEQTYTLEFGEYYMRVIADGGLITDAAVDIASVTAADPAVVTTTGAHGYSNDDWVYISGVQFIEGINNRWFQISAASGSVFTLTGEDQSAEPRGGLDGIAEREYVLVTPYPEDDLNGLNITQSADVITITHLNWTPREISRTDHNAWTIAEITFIPTIGKPQNVVASNDTGPDTHTYVVTAVDAENGEESRGALPADGNLVGYEGSIDLDWDEVENASGYNVYRDDGATYRKPGFIGTTSTNQFFDPGVSAPTTGDEIDPEWAISPPEAYSPFSDKDNQQDITSITKNNPGVVTMGAAHGYEVGDRVFINDEVAGMTDIRNTWVTVGTLGGAPPDTFEIQDTSGYADAGTGGVAEKYDGNDKCPSAVTYYEQRLVFGGTNTDPQKIWLSQSAAFHNMDGSRPSRDSDAIIFNIAAQQINVIRNLVPMRDLLVLTAGGEWRANGGESELMNATGGLAVRQQTDYGSGVLPAITIGNTTIFYQERGPSIRTIAYSFTDDQYMGVDLSILSRHLLEGFSLTEWAYAQAPHGVVWGVRDDGVLLGFTYQHEHKVWAWHRHDTEGLFESTTSTLEDADDAIYVVVKRNIDGTDKRFIERMHSRFFTSVRDAFFVDAGLTLDDPGDITNITSAYPPVVTAVDHQLSQDDYVDISDVYTSTDLDGNKTGMWEVNEHQYRVGWQLGAGVDITNITQDADHPVVTATGHGYSAGDHRIYLTGVTPTGAGTMGALLNDQEFDITYVDANSFTINYVDASGTSGVGTAGLSKLIDPDDFNLCEGPIQTVALSDISTDNPVEVLSAASDGFADYETGQEVYLYDIVGQIELNDRWFTITKVADDQISLDGEDGGAHTPYVSGGTARNNAIDGSAYTAYISGGEGRKAVTAIRGLDHLNGMTVTILANGMHHVDLEVEDGQITLNNPASRVHVGLGYVSSITTLPYDVPAQAGTLQGTRQNVSELILRVQKSVGFWAGPDVDNLYEAKWRSEYESYDQPVGLYTGDVEPLGLTPDWGRGTIIVVRQPAPLPLAINAIIAEVQLGK